MRKRAPLLLLVAGLLASPAWAAKEWYEHYREAQGLLRRGRYEEAVKSLREAIRQRPSSGLDVQTYGLEFIDYLPYYDQGLCHLALRDYNSALLMFNIEQEQGAILRRDHLRNQFLAKRLEAKEGVDREQASNERQRKARLALEEVRRLRREGDDRYKEGKLEDALASLVQAQKLAELVDPATQQGILDNIKKIRAELNERAEQAARAERIEKALTEGRRFLEAGRAADARLRFDEVLVVDPQNARARAGRGEAEERILAETTRQQREAAFVAGKALFDAGDYEKALRPLADAAADPANAEAQTLLAKAQKTLEAMRLQKDVHQKIEALFKEAEALLDAQRFPEAVVKLSGLLELDPSHVKGRERIRFAERMTGESLFEKIFPNQIPILTFLDAPGSVVEGETLPLLGLATDDRGLARIEYRAGDQLVSQQVLAPDPEKGEYPRAVRIEHAFRLVPGVNVLGVAATDSGGLSQSQTFSVTRKLRFYETRLFLPSAVAAALGLVGMVVIAQQARRRRAVRNRFNPYIAGAPVMDDAMFFGREKLLARIMNVLHHNSLMITGERRIGKTTFLYHLKKALEADEGTEYQFFPVFTDLQGVAESAFFHTIMADVVDSLRLSPATISSLRFRMEAPSYEGRDFSHDLQRVIEELASRTRKRVKLALLIDEVDVLNEYSERINQRLRSIFMKTFSEHLVAVMSGVGIKRIWNSEGSPWYNFFDEIELAAFTREEAEALIRDPVGGVFRFETEAVERILALSQLKPYLIQKYCIHAVNRMLEDGRTQVTAEDVHAVRDAVRLEDREPSEGQIRHEEKAAETVAD
jgi:tetratricopeptide (TPR) repeat protein